MVDGEHYLSAEFGSIYQRLGVTLIERGESFYQPMMGDIVTDLESKSKPSTVIMNLHQCSIVFIFHRRPRSSRGRS